MPCRYEETPEEIQAYREARRKSDTKKETERAEALKKELDKVTAMLCRIMTDWDTEQNHMSLVIKTTPGLTTWWAEHKHTDARRKEKETAEIKTRALKKLSKKERQVLGLKEELD